tara:strand:- start:204 stop:692 length:489 start_codon:yes stop_codon:yes gene_type:complete
MNKDTINESLIYDELGFIPIWKTLPKKSEVQSDQLLTNLSILHLKKIKLEDCNILFIAQIFNSTDTVELELFKKISAYLDTISDKLSELQPLKIIQESELASEIESCEHLVFLGQGLEKLIKKETLNIPYIITVSLKEMAENPENKRKLWQDIKELSKSINQ